MCSVITSIYILLCCILQTKAQSVSSPDGQIQLSFSTTDLAQPQYSVLYKSNPIIKESKLIYYGLCRFDQIIYVCLIYCVCISKPALL